MLRDPRVYLLDDVLSEVRARLVTNVLYLLADVLKDSVDAVA